MDHTLELNVYNAMEYLSAVAATLPSPLQQVVSILFKTARFSSCPGGKSNHHQFMGGLALHTAEVVRNTFILTGDTTAIDRDALTVAALMHDFCKVYEYGFAFEADGIRPGSIVHLPYAQLIGHVVGSAMLFRERALNTIPLGLTFIDHVTHIMLAHHGRREWRSPVEPHTPEAWILHAADMLSGRP